MARTILVVEDDLHARRIVEVVLRRDRMLRYLKLEVVCAADGVEGLEAFDRCAPDLLITDLLMPRMDGFQLVEQVRARPAKRQIPIIVTSAVFRDQGILKRLVRGFDVQVLPKPISPHALARMVREVLGGREAGASGRPAKRARDAEAVGSARKRAPRASLVDAVLGSDAAGAAPAPTVREGQLAQVPLPSLLLELFEALVDGTLELKRGKLRKLIYLAGGYPIFVNSNLRAETLGQLLVRRGGLTEAQHQEVWGEVQQQGIKYGEALVRLKLMSELEVMAELVQQTRFKVESCLRWPEGSFAVVEDAGAPGKVPRCTVDPIALVFGGLRRSFNAEEALGRLARRPNTGGPLAFDARFDAYRGRFVEAFGAEVVEELARGASLAELMHTSALPDLLLPVDTLFECGLARFDPVVAERRQLPAQDERVADSLSLGHLAQPDILLAVRRDPLAAPAGDETSQTQAPEMTPAPVPRGADPARRVHPEVVTLARQLIESTYLGLHGGTHYQVLGVIAETDPAGIEVAYQIKRKQLNLERFRGMDLGESYGHLEEIVTRLDESFAVLSSAERRMAYDVQLQLAQVEARSSTLDAEKLFWAGGEALDQGLYDEAVRCFTRATELDRQADYVAARALAGFLAGGGETEAAVAAMVELQAILADQPEHLGALLTAARIAREVGNDEEARQSLEAALRIDPAQCQAFDELEQLLVGSESFVALERQYRLTIHLLGQRDPGWAALLWKRLALLYRDRLGDLDSARVACEAVLRLDPSDAEWVAIAAALAGLPNARWPEAVLGYRSLLRSNPEQADSLHELFRLHRDEGRTDAAYLVASIAVLRGLEDDEQRAFYQRHRPQCLRRVGRVIDEQWLALLRHPADNPKAERLFELLEPTLASLFPPLEAPAATAQATVSEAFESALHYVCWCLRVPIPSLVAERTMTDEIEGAGSGGPVLLVGSQRLDCSDRLTLCFSIGRAVALLTPGRRVVGWQPFRRLQAALQAAFAACGWSTELDGADGAKVEKIKKEIERTPALRSALSEAVETLARHPEVCDLRQWQRGAVRTAERIGLLLCTDMITAGVIVSRTDREARDELIDFALSEAYAELRQSLGLAVC